MYDNYPSVIEALATDAKLNHETFEILKSAWRTLKTLNYPEFHPRVINAFDFYYFSWNSINLHSTTINLSVVLETLFSPSSTNELSHQIAYNVAKFLYSDRKERIAGYQFVKKFYSIRSKLVHGGDIKSQDLVIVVEFFKLISSILLTILTDITLFNTFNEDRMRKKFLEEFLFDKTAVNRVSRGISPPVPHRTVSRNKYGTGEDKSSLFLYPE